VKVRCVHVCIHVCACVCADVFISVRVCAIDFICICDCVCVCVCVLFDVPFTASMHATCNLILMKRLRLQLSQ